MADSEEQEERLQEKKEEKPLEIVDEDDSDEDDDDYVPSGEEKGLSEEDSDDEVEDDIPGGDDDEDGKLRGRKRHRKPTLEEDVKHVKTEDKPLSEEEEKKRIEELWSELHTNDEKPPSVNVSCVKPEPIQEKPTSTEPTTSTQSRPFPPVRKPTGGLGSLVSQLKGKSKTSTLSQSKNDWQRYKEEEGLEEELAEHTKSKDSFVERQAFLQRADLRQFEVEKSIRDRIRAKKN